MIRQTNSLKEDAQRHIAFVAAKEGNSENIFVIGSVNLCNQENR